MPRKKKKLSAEQKAELFVAEYLISRNATQAAIKAGYAPKSARITGSRLLSSANIRADIDQAQAERVEKLEIKGDDILRQLLAIATSDIGELCDDRGNLRPLSEIPPAFRRLISSLKIKKYTEGHGEDAEQVQVTEFRIWDKMRALHDLAQHLGLIKAGNAKVNITAAKVYIGFSPDEM